MSAGIAALVAHVGFWFLLAYGWFWDEIGVRGTAVFVGLWVSGMYALKLVQGDAMFSSYVAALDIALVFVIFKGDVRLT